MNVNPEHYVARQAYLHETGPGILENQMDNFANASFAPDLIAVMQNALEGAVSTLPHPVSSGHIKSRFFEVPMRASEIPTLCKQWHFWNLNFRLENSSSEC